MIFLIEYEPKTGAPAKVTNFPDERRHEAVKARLELELRAHRDKRDTEIVVLEAKSESAIRRTHQRYFESHDNFLRSFLAEAA